MDAQVLSYMPLVSPVATLIVVIVGVLFSNRHVDVRIGDLRSQMGAQIGDLRSHMDARFDAMDQLFQERLRRVEEVVDARLSRIEQEIHLK